MFINAPKVNFGGIYRIKEKYVNYKIIYYFF